MSLVYCKREKKEERRKVTRKKAYFSETSRFKINFNPEKLRTSRKQVMTLLMRCEKLSRFG